MKININLYVLATLSIALDSLDNYSEIIIDYWDEYYILAILGVINRAQDMYSAHICLTEFGRKCQLHKNRLSAWILVPLD